MFFDEVKKTFIMTSKLRTLFPILILAITLISCDEALECTFGLNPKFKETRIATATIDRPYREFISAEVTNDSNDDSYDYFFEIIGDLPAGIDVVFLSRRIEFIGTPQEIGTFDFTVFLYVERFEDGFLDTSPTCKDEVSRDFSITVLDN